MKLQKPGAGAFAAVQPGGVESAGHVHGSVLQVVQRPAVNGRRFGAPAPFVRRPAFGGVQQKAVKLPPDQLIRVQRRITGEMLESSAMIFSG